MNENTNAIIYSNNSKIELIHNYYHKKKDLIGNILQTKSIFREYRTLKAINKKSEYLIQLKDIKINKKDDNYEIDFIFLDEGVDLFSLINSKIFDYKEQHNLIKWILFQVLKGLETLHSLNIIHRDINPNHIIISSKGEIKIIGFSHSINDIESKFIDDKIIGKLSYLAPECLISLNYNNKIDIWATGVLMLELYNKKTNLLNSNEGNEKKGFLEIMLTQLKYLSKYFNIPFSNKFELSNNNLKEDLSSWLSNAKFDQEKLNKKFIKIPDIDKDGVELLKRLLTFNPKERITAKEALKSPYFKEFQYFNKEEYKKSKIRENDDLSFFLKNLEKEFQNKESLPNDKKYEFFKKEIININQNKFTDKINS